jgi:UDP-N-acetylglucosamine:LPS N-acetylglucosamine transferase
VQLLRLRQAWEGCDVAFATTQAEYAVDVRDGDPAMAVRFYVFPDANRNEKLRLVRQLIKVLWIVLRERPDLVISTGASAGYFALRAGKYLGCRTVWVDSIANVEELSLAGRRVGPYADLWLTQWPELAVPTRSGETGPRYFGAVL